MEIKPAHPGHVHIRNQAGGPRNLLRLQKILRGRKRLSRISQRLHQAFSRFAHRLVVVNDRNQRFSFWHWHSRSQKCAAIPGAPAQAHVSPIFQELRSSSIIRWFTQSWLKARPGPYAWFCGAPLDRDFPCRKSPAAMATLEGRRYSEPSQIAANDRRAKSASFSRPRILEC